MTWESSEEDGEIRADLVVVADGRDSTIRAAVNHVVEQEGIPIDVLWFRLDRPERDDKHSLAWLKNGHMLVTIPRRDHYQTAMVIKKGAFDAIRPDGLEAFRNTIGEVCSLLADVAQGIREWSQVKLLTVQISHLKKWYEPGLLFIGDAAHAMSPVGGVGINLAIQDAVAAANELAAPLSEHSLTEAHFTAIQHRRERASRRTHSDCSRSCTRCYLAKARRLAGRSRRHGMSALQCGCWVQHCAGLPDAGWAWAFSRNISKLLTLIRANLFSGYGLALKVAFV